MKKQLKKFLSGFIIATLMATSIGFGDLEALRTESKTESENVLESQLAVSTETTTGSALDLKEDTIEEETKIASVDEDKFTFNKETGEITGYKDQTPPENLVIPETIDGVKVKGIGVKAFYYSSYKPTIKTQIKNITFPDGLEYIGEYAFQGNLFENIVIPDTVTKIEQRAFWGNQISNLILPANLKTIGNDAFEKNMLSSINLPSGLESIGSNAFKDNILTSINLPEGLKKIGAGAFTFNAIDSIEIPDSVNDLPVKGNSVFWRSNTKNTDSKQKFTKIYSKNSYVDTKNTQGIINPASVTVKYMNESGEEILPSKNIVGVEIKSVSSGKLVDGDNHYLSDYNTPSNEYKDYNFIVDLSANYFKIGQEQEISPEEIGGYKTPEKIKLTLEKDNNVVFTYKSAGSKKLTLIGEGITSDKSGNIGVNSNVKVVILPPVGKVIDKLNVNGVDKKSEIQYSNLEYSYTFKFMEDTTIEAVYKDDSIAYDKEFKFEVDKTKFILGEKAKLSALYRGQAVDLTTSGIEFSTAPENILKLDTKTGEVRALKSGTVILTGMLKGRPNTSQSIEITVEPFISNMRVEGYGKTIAPLAKIEITDLDLKKYNIDTEFTEPKPIHCIIAALEKVGIDCADSKKGMNHNNGSYIDMIDGLATFSTGRLDGWMYFVDNGYANQGVNAFDIHSGQSIVMYFVEDYTKNTFSWFDKEAKTSNQGEEVSLNLTGTLYDMNTDKSTTGPVSDAVILVDNKPYEIDGKVVKTDKDGNAVLKFEKDGKYIISAEKTETQIDKKTKKEVTKRIITRPYCEITIFKGEEPENPLKQIDTSITVDGISKNILETQALKIEENSFALDVLRKSLDQSKIKYEITEGPYGPYVLSINDEKAGTLGGYDGWIYEVNGKSPEVGAGAYKLKDGDKVKFFYSRWPKLNTSSKIVSGEKNPIVKVSLSGDTFKENATGIDNWTITSSEVGLKLKAISKIDNQNMEFVFEGISKDGKLSIIPKKEILVSQKESDSVFVEISSYKKQLEDTLKYLSDKLTKPSVGNEWPILALARSEYSLDKAYVDSYIKNVEKNSANMSKATDYERVAIAITALGKDAEDIGGINLFEKLANFDFLDRQGINASIFGLIAANTRGYEIPKVEGTVNQNSKDNMLEYILSEELDGGGWALYGEVADPDITAMAIQALAPYYKQGDKTVEEAVDRALKVLSKLQTQDGDYLSWGSANPESAVQVLVALCELGKDPMDSKNGFVKDGKTLIDGIMKYKVDGGGFKHSLSETSVNGMATEQCAYGLVAYERFVNGKTSLYDMSDVEFKTDKTKLSDLIKEAKSKNKRDYKKESWKNLVSVLESAKKVNSNPTSKQKDIDAAIKGLESALLKLELKKSEKLELKDGKVEIPLDDDKDFDVELKSDQKAQILIPENAESKVLLKTESKKALSEIKVKKGKHGLKIPQGVKIEEGHAEIELFIMKTEAQKAEIKDELSDKIKKLDSKVKDVKVEDAFKIGNTNKIEFSDYVELVFTNMAGKGAAYVDDTGMHIIERVVDEKAGLGKTEYAFDRGTDLVVKTKHFTDFITYSLEKDAGNTGGGTDGSGGTGGAGGGTPSKDLTVTLSIDKKTINKGYVLEPTVIKINKGDTVWNVLQKELDNRGVSYRYNNSNQYGSVYVESIAGDGEFDHGRWSGWMYNVNGKYPNYGCSKYILNGGENIEWRYTTNLGEDLGQDNSAWGKPGESTKTETIEKGSTVLKSEAKVEQKEAKAEIDSKFIKGIVSEAVEKKLSQIVIEPTIEDKKAEFNKVSVVLEKESIEKIAKEAKASLKLKTKFGDVKLSANTLENLLKEKGNTVTISVKQNEDNTVTVDVKAGLDILDKISGGMIVALPVSEAYDSNIMVKVADDNTEQIIMKSVAADKALSAKLDGSSTVKIVQREVDFADTSAHWAKENIEFVSARDIIKGTKANEFSPNSRVNRAMLTTILHRFENEMQVEGQNYSDVTKEAYYSNAALWAKTKGIVSRTEKFGAKEELTREQIAEMIYNYAKASGENVSNISKANVQKFEDFSTIDSASQDAVAYCYEKGIIGGKSETKLDPKGKTTRAEVSAIIQRYISNSVK